MLSQFVLTAAALLGIAAAQVTTSCQPLNTTCPPDPAFGTQYLFNFSTSPSSDLWENYGGVVNFDDENGATFTIASEGDSPTIRTKFYFFFGRTELIMKTSPGTGIVSSMMWLSDDLDEVDFEFLGTNTTDGFSNFFGKGVQDYHNSGAHPVSDPQGDFHNYTVDWTAQQLQWYIDGNLVRTLTPDQASNGSYPQTPMRLSLGIWAGGAPGEPIGVVQWAGGHTDYSQGPFNMYIKSAFVQDYSSGSEYEYGDHSGTWQSIKVLSGNSSAVQAITNANYQAEPLSQKWANLPEGAKIGIYAGAGAFVAIAVGSLIYSCYRRKSLRNRAARLNAQQAETDRLEMERLKREGIDPDSFAEEGQEYNSNEMKKDGLVDVDSYSIPPSPMMTPNSGAGSYIPPPAAAMRSPESRMASPAPSSMYRETRSPTTPQLGGLGAPPSFNGPSRQGYSRLPPQSPYQEAPPPLNPQMRSQSPMMRSQSPAMPPPSGALPPTPVYQSRSDSGPAAYGRRGSPGPQQDGFGAPRMQSPAPIRPPPRNLTAPQSGYQSPSQSGVRGPPPRRDQWSEGGYR